MAEGWKKPAEKPEEKENSDISNIMATSAITENLQIVNKKKATNAERSKAPTTGGVRYNCQFCNSKGYSDMNEDDQHEIFNLLYEMGDLRNENDKLMEKLKEMEREESKIKLMNIEMEAFLT